MHEWLMVAEAPTFKRWGMTAEDIARLRTQTSEITQINPFGGHAAAQNGNGFHTELRRIIQNSTSFEQFKNNLNNWAAYRLQNGASDLPLGLRR